MIMYWVYVSQNKAFQAQCALDGIPSGECNLLDKLINDFKSVNIFWAFVTVACFQLSNIVRSIRWKMIFEPMGYTIKFSNAFWTIMIGYLANLGLSRAGEVVRAASLAKFEHIRLDKVIGTVALDRILDLLTMGVVVILAFTLQYQEIYNYLAENMKDFDFSAFLRGTIFQSFAFGILLLVLLLVIFNRQVRKSVIYIKIIDFVKGFYEGIRVIKRIKQPLVFILLSLSIWLLYFLMTYFAFFSFEPTSGLGMKAALLVFVFGSFGILIPSPGGMGTYHALVVAALAVYGIQGGDAFSYANIVFFFVQILTTITFGIMGIIFMRLDNRHYLPHHSYLSEKEPI